MKSTRLVLERLLKKEIDIDQAEGEIDFFVMDGFK